VSRVYYTGSSPLGGTTPMRTLEAMTGYYGIVGYPVPQLPHGVTASRGNFLITGRSADLLLFGPVYYGCGAQPTIPPGAATLVGNDYFDGALNNHRITGGTHNRTYSHVGFTGDVTYNPRRNWLG